LGGRIGKKKRGTGKGKEWRRGGKEPNSNRGKSKDRKEGPRKK